MIEFIKENVTTIIVVGFVATELITIPIVLWETFTGKSIIDVIFDLATKTTENERKDNDE